MLRSVSSAVILSLITLNSSIQSTIWASSLEIIVNNKCNWYMDIYNHDIYKQGGRGFNHVCRLKPKSGSCKISITRPVHNSGLIKNILGEQATLFEFTKNTEGIYYDISVIPPGSGNCYSWEECFNKSKKRGFNDALNVIVKQKNNQNLNQRCRNLYCRHEKCEDAYLWPFDDEKTFFCPLDTEFTLDWC